MLTEVPIRTLRPNTRFRLLLDPYPAITGTVLAISAGSALVRLDAARTSTFQAHDAEQNEVDVTIRKAVTQNWCLSTPVVPLIDQEQYNKSIARRCAHPSHDVQGGICVLCDAGDPTSIIPLREPCAAAVGANLTLEPIGWPDPLADNPTDEHHPANHPTGEREEA